MSMSGCEEFANLTLEDPDSESARGRAARPGFAAPVPTVDDVPRLSAELRSGDEAVQLDAVASFRKMLSKEDNPPIDAVSRGGGAGEAHGVSQ